MVQKAHSLFKIVGIIFISLNHINCNNHKEKDQKSFSLLVDTSMIPKDTIQLDNKNLKLDNGVYYLDTKPFSGYIKEVFNHQIISVGSYLNGKQEGTTKTFFPNGKLKDSRSYKDNKAFGRHYGYWSNGKMKFDFIYVNEKREGLQKQWYESGTPYAFLTFKDDREAGMQKAWRENGKPYINYEAKDGFRYGLQKSALCYSLRNGKIQMKR
jgi:antitoxin component YwqK of YwqJK toxin-antitoxin module